jgi:hypothetical protein
MLRGWESHSFFIGLLGRFIIVISKTASEHWKMFGLVQATATAIFVSKEAAGSTIPSLHDNSTCDFSALEFDHRREGGRGSCCSA